MSMAIRYRHTMAGGLGISIKETEFRIVPSKRKNTVMTRALLFLLLLSSAATTNCLSASAAHKIIIAGIATPGIVVAISLSYKTIKKVVQTTERHISAQIQEATTNNCHWLRPQ